MKYLKYDLSTGRIISTGECPESMYEIQANAGEGLLPVHASLLNDCVDLATGTVTPLPARLSEHHVFDYVARRWNLNSEGAWLEVRRLRDVRLAETDWTTLSDVPLSEKARAAWKAYRQALRDVTAQTDPLAISWPVREADD